MSNGNTQALKITEAARGEIVLETVVRPTEIDVNGHVNNGKYVEYLEWGREEWYDRNNFSYGRLKGLAAITVVVNLNVNYRRPCHQGDRLRITTWPGGHGRSSFTLVQRIDKVDGTVAADAVVTLVTIDPDTRRARPLPEEFARLFHE